MAFETAYNYIKSKGMAERVLVFAVSSATVELAAKAVGCAPERIAKSLTFMLPDGAIMIVCAGDAKISNQKYKTYFGTKAKMLARDEVPQYVGHDVGGVCPFGVKSDVKIYLDNSLKRFNYVYPACGSGNSAVKLSPDELDLLVHSDGWIDVCTIV